METLERPVNLNPLALNDEPQHVIKFQIEEIHNPLVRSDHVLVTSFDGMKPGAETPRGLDATGYALPNKNLFMFEPLERPVNLYRKEIAEDGRPIWFHFGHDPNLTLFELINLKRIDRQTQKELATQNIDTVLAPTCDTEAPKLNWLQKLLVFRSERTIQSYSQFYMKLRQEWVYTQNV